jgi:hypothetical protein
MSSRPTWFWTSLFSSIGVNAVLLTSSACWLYSQTKIYLPGYARSDVFVPIFLADANSAPIPDTTLGDADGKGDAADQMPGDEPMQAKQGPQAQAFLSRDPEGPGKTGQDPSMSTAIPGENGSGDEGAAARFGAVTPPAEAQPTPTFAPKPVAEATPTQEKQPIAEEKPDPSQRTAQDDKQPERDDSLTKLESSHSDAPASSPVAYASAAEMLPTPPAPQPSSSGGEKADPPVAPADPAPQSDSESDPFSKKGAVHFKRGATDVQFGRKHKIIRPRLGLAAQTDLLNLRDPVTLVLALTLDESGKVIKVDVLKTSGSRNLDQACKVAAYQWWLEPTKDKATGKAIKDVVPFVIGFS